MKSGGEQASFRALTFTADGKSLVTSGPDCNIRFWDAETGEELRRIAVEELPGPLVLSSDGKKLAVIMPSGTAIRILDLKSGQATMPPAGHLMSIASAALTPDGRTAVTGSPFGPLLVWDAATGRLRRRLEGRHHLLDTLQLGGDGQTLFTCGWDKSVRVWDMATGTERRRLAVERDHARTEADRANRWLVVTPDGKTLAAMDAGKTIRILDAASGAERQHFHGPKNLLGMGLTLDGRSLIVWSDDFKVRVWDTVSGRKLREYPLVPDMGIDDNGRIIVDECDFALSHDGRLLALGFTIDNNKLGLLTSSLILKDLATGQIVHRCGGLPRGCAVVAFSPDDRMLAWSGFYDPSIRLLETASGGERRRLTGHRGRITTLAFSADRRRLLSGSNDTTALVWDLSANSLPLPVNAAMESLWNDLAGTDAARAYAAIHKLAAAPNAAIPFLRKHLSPVPVADAKRVARRIADLDSDDFAIRQRATVDLQKLGEQALPAYRQSLEGKPSLEMRRRLEDLQAKAQAARWDVSGERLRSLRAIEALELAGTEAAREVLQTLAAGAEGTRLTEEAKAALERVAKRRDRT